MRAETASLAEGCPRLGAADPTVKSTGIESWSVELFGLLQLCYKSVDSQQRLPMIDDQNTTID
jgi:hypothetical protein